MRIDKKHIKLIKKLFLDIFKTGNVYLFGSRVDDTKKGGDIDLYIDVSDTLTLEEKFEKRTKFRLQLYDVIGEQKIDIVISKDKNRAIEQEILKTGVLL